ncbi:hypothetical protein [Undibacterium sp. Di24W]|uniref:hypothetical protein n=1 Tax=Undibacterium sp. Di24W TaxID=3413033 RepID=UPI003BF42C58
MRKYIWLLLLTIPPWAAVEFGSPKWVVTVAVVPFFLLAMTMGDSDEYLLGEASEKFRKGALVVIGVGGLILGGAFFILWQLFFPSA